MAMNYSIQDLKKLGVTFSFISESDAEEITRTEYPLSKLMRYSVLFDRYRSTTKAGLFLDLDFAYLYDLSLLDSELRKIILCLCLDVEQSLKTVFLYDCERANCQESIVRDFITSDPDYLLNAYNAQNLDLSAKKIIGDNPIDTLTLDDFLEILQFGTFQRFSSFFYQRHAQFLYGREQSPMEPFFDSVRILRNTAAHNNTVLDGLSNAISPNFRVNYGVLSFLGRSGIKSRTLETNMAKQPIHDFVCLIHLYSRLESPSKTQHTLVKVLSFLEERCTRHSEYYIKNPTLLSAYRFLVQVINVYCKNIC